MTYEFTTNGSEVLSISRKIEKAEKWVFEKYREVFTRVKGKRSGDSRVIYE